jgi:hypothetical protein
MQYLKEIDHSEVTSVDGMIILKCALKKYRGWCGLNSHGYGEGPVAGSFG